MKNTTTPAAPEIPPTLPESLHQPFSWLPHEHHNDHAAKFVELVFDVSRGIEACLRLVDSADMERLFNEQAQPENGEAQTPIIDQTETEKLRRLAMASAGMLANEAERRIGLLNRAERGGAKS